MTEMLVERTVELDAELLQKAAEILGTKTDNDTINATLEYLVNGHRRQEALERLREFGKRGDLPVV